MTVELTDWRGNTYGVGDIVLYARQCGYAVEVVECEVLAITERGHVRVQPLRSSRTAFGKDAERPYSWLHGDKPVTLTRGVASITVLDADAHEWCW